MAQLSDVFGDPVPETGGLFDENAINRLGILVNAPGSELTNAQLTSDSNFSRLIYLTGRISPVYANGRIVQNDGVVLTAGSVTDLSGASIVNPRAGAKANGGGQKILGRIVDGGTLQTVSALSDSTVFAPFPAFGTARYIAPISGTLLPVQRAELALAAQAGARIDLRGAADRYDQETALGVFELGDVWSNGGRLTLGGSGSLTGAQLFAQGVTPVYERPIEITARMAKEVEMFTALGKRANISMD